MNSKRRKPHLLSMAIVAIGALYASAPLAKDAAEQLQQILTKRFPDIKIERVMPSVLPGLYEIITPTEIVYADAGGEHLILGQIMATETRENLTEKRWYEINKIDFNALPFEQAIKIVKGNGRRRLAIFEDPFCPYCQELERDLQGVDDVTIYVFLYPLEQLHPSATDAARDIWCSNDRATAWTEWMLNKKAPSIADCKHTPIEQLAALGEKLRVNSTPTLFFPDGSRLPGAIDADKLEKKIAAANPP